MPLPTGHPLVSPRELTPFSGVSRELTHFSVVSSSEYAIGEDGGVLESVPLVSPARKLSQAAMLFLAFVALALVLLIKWPFIHISSGGEYLKHGQTEPLQLIGDGYETSGTTATTTKFYPNLEWIKFSNSLRFPDLCASQEEQMAPLVGQPVLGGAEVVVKVLTYNLHWWQLFDRWLGRGGSAGKLIAASNAEGYFDVLAFQECGDKDRVMKDAGLLEYYKTFSAPYQKCVAYRKDAWDFLDEGHVNVTHDVAWNNWGMRGVQYLRLRHNKSGHAIFFVNYHGGLSVNVGGVCGGKAAARNILHMINNRSHYDDRVILVGDFNSNLASFLIQELQTSLLHVYSGKVLGGIDNFFTNLPASSVIGSWNLGTGGSDHDALVASFNLGAKEDTGVEKKRQFQDDAFQRLRNTPPVYDWENFWCGVAETDVEYIVSDDSSWSQVKINLSSPDWCCRECQEEKRCHAWMYHGMAGQENVTPPSTRCVMSSAVVESKAKREGFVSGLPFQTVAATLKESLDSTPSSVSH